MRWITPGSYWKQVWGARGIANEERRREARQRNNGRTSCTQVITESSKNGFLYLAIGDRRGRVRAAISLNLEGVACLIETFEGHLARHSDDSFLEDADYNGDEDDP